MEPLKWVSVKVDLKAQLLKALKESADLAWDISHEPLSGSDQTRLATIRRTLNAAIRAAEGEKKG